MRKTHSTLSISTAPHECSEIRRATRILSMVHELHKAGYQGIRICCGLSDRNSEWTCHIFSAETTAPSGWAPAFVERAAKYTVQSNGDYFDWKDSANDNARELALKFLTRETEITREGAIEDWEYAGWLTSIIGLAENGKLPAFYGGLEREKEAYRETTLPPSTKRRLKFDHGDNCVFSFIENRDLELQMLPPVSADLEEMMSFVCDTYYIYRLGILDIDELHAAYQFVKEKGLERVSMHGLRAYGYYLNRSLKWSDAYIYPDSLERNYTQPLRLMLAEIRKRLTNLSH